MTKMQIIAKAVLAGLGFYCVGIILRSVHRQFLHAYGIAHALAIIALVLAICAVILLVLWRISRNGQLARKLAGEGPALDRKTQRTWLAASFRLSCVFAGLFLLAGSITEVVDAVVKVAQFLPAASQWFNNLVSPGQFLEMLLVLILSVVKYLVGLGFLAFIVYLMLGAPSFIRWQIKRSVSPPPFSIQPERSNNE
ncbi:MAG: hypothetical protein J7M40_00555 [Planctomycetes bacterium]|nr:hypothetical protein [Planctomycetota bacterium]